MWTTSRELDLAPVGETGGEATEGTGLGGGVSQFPVHSGMGKTDLSLRPSAVFIQSSASRKTVEACAPLSLPFSAPLSPWEPNARIKM